MTFPRDQWYKTFNDDEIVKAGSFIPNTNDELRYIRPYFFINNSIFGTERFRCIIYSDNGYTSPLYTSSWSNFSSISNLAANWQGFIRSDFADEHLKEGVEYYLAIEIDNYVRNGMTFYIALKYDYDNSIYPKVSTQFVDYPIACEYYTRKEFEE